MRTSRFKNIKTNLDAALWYGWTRQSKGGCHSRAFRGALVVGRTDNNYNKFTPRARR